MGTCGAKNKNKNKKQNIIPQQQNPKKDETINTQQNQNLDLQVKGANDHEQTQAQQEQKLPKPQEVQSQAPAQNQEKFQKLSEVFGNKNPPAEIPASLIVITKQKQQDVDPAQHHLECLKNQNEEGQYTLKIGVPVKSENKFKVEIEDFFFILSKRSIQEKKSKFQREDLVVKVQDDDVHTKTLAPALNIDKIRANKITPIYNLIFFSKFYLIKKYIKESLKMKNLMIQVQQLDQGLLLKYLMKLLQILMKILKFKNRCLFIKFNFICQNYQRQKQNFKKYLSKKTQKMNMSIILNMLQTIKFSNINSCQKLKSMLLNRVIQQYLEK